MAQLTSNESKVRGKLPFGKILLLIHQLRDNTAIIFFT